MKKFWLGAAAALAISAPGVASAQNGYIDLSYHSTDAEVGGVKAEGDGWSAGGAFAWGGNGSLGFQGDAQFSSSDDGGADSWSVGGHVFNRNESHLFGGFVNYGNTDVDSLGDYDVWSAGIEGQMYLGRTTIDGAVSYSEGDDVDVSLTAADLGLTVFQTDNFSFGGNFGFGNLDFGVGDSEVSSAGLGAEWQLTAAPISIFGGFQHVEIRDLDSDADILSVGVRYNMGGTLFERNRSGPSLARGGGLGRFNGLF